MRHRNGMRYRKTALLCVRGLRPGKDKKRCCMEQYPHIKKPPVSEADWFNALAQLARYLRGPEGCPWDRKQTAKSFASYLQEEVEEFQEALRDSESDHIEEEFGDVLFCLLATAAAAEDEGRFSLRKALQSAHEKMIRRHEHVFGDERADSPEAAMDSWNRIKAQEKKRLK